MLNLTLSSCWWEIRCLVIYYDEYCNDNISPHDARVISDTREWLRLKMPWNMPKTTILPSSKHLLLTQQASTTLSARYSQVLFALIRLWHRRWYPPPPPSIYFRNLSTHEQTKHANRWPLGDCSCRPKSWRDLQQQCYSHQERRLLLINFLSPRIFGSNFHPVFALLFQLSLCFLELVVGDVLISPIMRHIVIFLQLHFCFPNPPYSHKKCKSDFERQHHLWFKICANIRKSSLAYPLHNTNALSSQRPNQKKLTFSLAFSGGGGRRNIKLEASLKKKKFIYWTFISELKIICGGITPRRQFF